MNTHFIPLKIQAAEGLASLPVKMGLRIAGVVVLVTVLSAGRAWGQLSLPKSSPNEPANPQAGKAPTAGEIPEDPLGRDTPYGTVVGFLKAAEQANWERAASFLDSKLPPEEKRQLARQLKQVLDRGLSLDLDTVSKSAEGSPTEKWRVTRNEIGTAHIGDQRLVILLDRIQPVRKAAPYWLFSSETLSGVPQLALNLEAAWFEKYLPKALLETRVFNVAVFRWVVIPLLVGAIFLFILVMTWLLRMGAEWILRKSHRHDTPLAKTGFLGPVRVLVLAFLIHTASPLASTLVARQIWRQVAAGVAILGGTWLLMRVLDLVVESAVARFERTNSLRRVAPLKLVHWVTKAVLIVMSAALILYELGINPTAVVTGLGVGGIALAFAAQKTIENVFGAVMIVVDQPLRVGDFCKIGDTLGTIEEIGLRCTRVRTLNRTLVTIPNGQLASMVLENYTSREKIWLRHVIGVRYETTADQLRYVLTEIRAYLEGHPKVEYGTWRVRFIRFGSSSIDFEIFAYVLLNDYAAFLEVQEEILLRFMDIIAEAGTGIAFPSQTTYLAKDAGLDAEKSRAAIEKARQRTDEAATR